MGGLCGRLFRFYFADFFIPLRFFTLLVGVKLLSVLIESVLG
jgi:hypothetical protein